MRELLLLFIVLLILSTSVFSQQLNIYVSPNGSSTGNGASSANPVSLSRAQALAKSTKYKKATCNIWLMDGIYTYLSLDTTDSRTSSAPLTYHALNYHKAIFQPISPISPKDLQPIPDSIKSRIVDTVAKTKVKQVDLSSYNLSNMTPWPISFGYPVNVTATGSSRQNWPIVYQNSTPLPMAQYPNGDSVMRMKSVVNVGGIGAGASAGIFKYRDDRCKYWQQAIKEGLWLRGNWRVDWQMDFVKTDSITLADSTVYQSTGVFLGIGNKYARPAGNGKEPYVAVNLLEEIDIPGEWAINFNTKMLYIYPPDTGSLNISSNSTMPTISLSNVSNTSFEGIVLDGGSGIGIKLNNCTNVFVGGTDIKHLASYGILIADGSNCTIRSNDIHEVGEGGVYVVNSNYNADQLLVKPCNHRIINNHIYNYAQDVFLYAAAIDTRYAIGCYAAYNNIHDCKHVGVLFGGNNNVFEYNDISQVVSTYTDMGAFYTSENQSKRGSKILNNYIHDMNYKGSALYADNNSQGATFNNNIATNCLYGTQNNYGLFNIFNNNIYYDNYKYQCTYVVAFTDTVSTSAAYTKVKAVYSASPSYQSAYPELKDYFDTVNKAYTSAVWPQINGSVFIGTSINMGRCISSVSDKSLFLSSGKTNTTYAQTGAPFTQYGLVCNNNFLAKTSLFKQNSNLLDSLRSAGSFAKTAIPTNWHISRIGLFQDSIYRPDITQTQTAGVSPSFSFKVTSLHNFTSSDTITIAVTIKNPNIKNSFIKVLLTDSGIVKPSPSFTLTKSSYDSIVLTAKWINPAIGTHVISARLYDSTLWQFSSDTVSFAIQQSLPIGINNFSAIANDCNALLSWDIDNATDARECQIEKLNEKGYFELIKTMPMQTDASHAHYATAIAQQNEMAQYRLRVITNTGAYYSSIKVVKTNCHKPEALVITPNPSHGNIITKLSGLSTNANITVTDMFGRVVWQSQSGNNKTINLPATNLCKGVYIVSVNNGGLHQELKWVISK